jgi:transposase
MGQASLIIGRERRRRFTEEQKFDLLTAAFGPGGNVAEVARRADICTSILYRWRKLHLAAQTPAFVPAIVSDEGRPAASCSISEAAITVELRPGTTVRIGMTAPAALVEAALRTLR